MTVRVQKKRGVSRSPSWSMVTSTTRPGQHLGENMRRMIDVLARVALVTLAVLAMAWPSAAGEQEDTAYLDFVALAREDTTKVNFATMRKLYEASSFYAMASSGSSKAPGPKVSITDEQAINYIDQNFATLDAQVYAMRIAEPKSQEFYLHRRAGNALFWAMIQAGNGLTKEAAIHVFSVQEERIVLTALQLEQKSQRSVVENGRAYDVLGVVGNVNRKAVELWFDVSAFSAKSTFNRSRPRIQT